MRLSSFVINQMGFFILFFYFLNMDGELITTAIAMLVEVSYGHVTFEWRYFYVIVELVLIIADFLVQFPFKYSL
jgi:hypothetical protein